MFYYSDFPCRSLRGSAEDPPHPNRMLKVEDGQKLPITMMGMIDWFCPVATLKQVRRGTASHLPRHDLILNWCILPG